jgi:hypothetical protein
VPRSNLYELRENDMHIYTYSNNFQHQTASILPGDRKSGFFARGPWGISVRETFSKNGVPTEEQAKAYITMLGSTAGLKGNLPSAAIFDFSPAAEADTALAVKK